MKMRPGSAQSNSDPVKYFSNHALIEIADENSKEVELYDPSYGKSYKGKGNDIDNARKAALLAFQKQAIDKFDLKGVAIDVPPDLAIKLVTLQDTLPRK
jgi:hypothetical protein